jgi:hypothetical protein
VSRSRRPLPFTGEGDHAQHGGGGGPTHRCKRPPPSVTLTRDTFPRKREKDPTATSTRPSRQPIVPPAQTAHFNKLIPAPSSGRIISPSSTAYPRERRRSVRVDETGGVVVAPPWDRSRSPCPEAGSLAASRNPAAEQRWVSHTPKVSEAPGALRPWASYGPRQDTPRGRPAVGHLRSASLFRLPRCPQTCRSNRQRPFEPNPLTTGHGTDARPQIAGPR